MHVFSLHPFYLTDFDSLQHKVFLENDKLRYNYLQWNFLQKKRLLPRSQSCIFKIEIFFGKWILMFSFLKFEHKKRQVTLSQIRFPAFSSQLLSSQCKQHFAQYNICFFKILVVQFHHSMIQYHLAFHLLLRCDVDR